jgi:benzoyl-CoA reductase/2-hydroxyglutaryl-CoA dehydratase subunit BcrC/BadD/HgdB
MINNILNTLKYIKIDGQVVYIKDQFCKSNGEYTSCEKLIASALELKQEGDK